MIDDRAVEAADRAYRENINAKGWRPAMRAALTAAAPFLTQIPDGWKTINTAPKDGRQILAFARGSSTSPLDVYFGVAQWAEKADWMPNSVADWFWSYAIRPTHWQPLPLPPPTEKNDG